MTIILSARGPRAIVSVDEAQKIVEQWESQVAVADDSSNNKPTTLDLSCRAWPLETLLVLEPFLQKHVGSIEVLKLDDIIASLETSKGLESLSFFDRVFGQQTPADSNRVTHVYLQDNATGLRGLQAMKNLFASPNLQHLNLHNNGMSKEVAEILCGELLVARAPNLLSLSLGRNQMGPEGAVHVSKLLPQCTSLQSFSYAGSRPYRDGTRAICQGLAQLTTNDGSSTDTNLRELDMDDCVFGTGDEADDPIHDLCATLKQSPCLTKLIVKDGALEADGLSAVLDALGDSGCSLQYLDVGALCFGLEGAEILGEYIKTKQLESIEELHVECNSLEDDGLQTLLNSLTECTKLRVLNINDNEITPDGFVHLKNYIIPSLQVLYCKDNEEDELDPDDLNQLRQLYPHVLVSEDDEEPVATTITTTTEEKKKEDDDAQVDALAATLGAAKI